MLLIRTPPHPAFGHLLPQSPLGEKALRSEPLSILQRYLASETETFFSTDLSAMYAYPVKAVTTFAKIDFINAFDRPVFTTDDLAVARTWRASMGVRF